MKRAAAEIAELSRLIDVALELPADERSTWIEQLPQAHDTLKPALRKLLAMPPAGNNTFTLSDVSRQVHAAMQGAASSAEALEFKDGARVGPYELIRELGRGGMGTVWLARRTAGLTRRTVALKLPHPGMLHAEFAARMERERDILESLAHPNIARLYDAGVTTAGQPYLALEYIEGVPINIYCDHKRLGLPERIRLFAQVLQAIQHAHSHLVIHRDLKPANILVTDAGNAVVLDFGIAKLMTEGATAETALTQFGGRALTPDYASPEQIAGSPLTTASDVYSLGVILYELLTGERPYKLARSSVSALEEAILAAHVRRPSLATTDEAKAVARATSTSKLARTLRGDLDTIVLTAMRVKLSERYRTADALAVDVEHFLENRAILARPESLWEASRRFVSRHRVAVGSAAIVVLALTFGILATSWQARKARESEQRAVAAAATSDAVKQFLVRIFQTNTLYQENAAKAREKNALQLLEAGADRVPIEFKDNHDLQREMFKVILRMLGESRSAEYDRHALEYIALLKEVPGREPEQADIYHELAIMQQGKDPKASAEFAQAGLKALGSSNAPEYRKVRGWLLTSYSVALKQQGDNEGALAPLLEAEKLLADGFSNTAEYSMVLSELGWRELRADNTLAAVDYLERAMKAKLADPTSYPRTLALGHGDLSAAYAARKQWADAAKELQMGEDLFRRQYGANDPETGLARVRRGKVIASQNRYDEAIALMRSGIRVLEMPSSNAVPDYLVASYEYLADALMQSGRIKEAGAASKHGLELAAKGSPQRQILPHFIAGELAAMRGETREAEAHARQAAKMMTDIIGANTLKAHKANVRLGHVLISVGKPDEADALFTAVMKADAAHAGTYDSPWTIASIQHARVLTLLGQPNQAVAPLDAVLAKFLAQPDNIRDLNEELELQSDLGRALMLSDRPRDGLPHLERALALLQPQYEFSPRLAESQIALADCKLRAGDLEGSRALLAKAQAIYAANGELGQQYRRPFAALAARLAGAAN
ncbi:MAG: protein kinase [Pseudomonadota bacterium]